MRVHTESIPERGLAVAADLSQDWARDAVVQAMGGDPSSIEADLLIKKFGTCMQVAGAVRVVAASTCTRCLAPLEVTMEGESLLYYSPEEAGSQPEELRLVAGDMDIGWFDGTALDMGQVLCELFTLWMPERLRCGEPSEGSEITLEIRRTAGEGPCEVHAHDGGPDLKRQSPFAGLTLPE
jgi:uncharacterized metal-binding protein YceD (DUF177 family)